MQVQDLKPTALQIIPSYHSGHPGPTSFLTPELPTLNEVRRGESPPSLPVLVFLYVALVILSTKSRIAMAVGGRGRILVM